VKYVPAISSETAIANQVSGQYDITCGNYVSYIQAQQSHQADLDIIAEGSTLQPGVVGIYTRPGAPIRSVKDLKGRAITINAPKNILYLLTASILAEYGVPPPTCISPSRATASLRCPPNSGPVTSTRLSSPSRSAVSRKRARVPCQWPTSAWVRPRISRSRVTP
jgi:hypothetical protein